MVVYNSVSQTDPDTQRIIAYPKGGGVYVPSRVSTSLCSLRPDAAAISCRARSRIFSQSTAGGPGLDGAWSWWDDGRAGGSNDGKAKLLVAARNTLRVVHSPACMYVLSEASTDSTACSSSCSSACMGCPRVTSSAPASGSSLLGLHPPPRRLSMACPKTKMKFRILMLAQALILIPNLEYFEST